VPRKTPKQMRSARPLGARAWEAGRQARVERLNAAARRGEQLAQGGEGGDGFSRRLAAVPELPTASDAVVERFRPTRSLDSAA
jgi:hypothetical protein